MPSVDDLLLNTPDWSHEESEDETSRWRNSDGDGLGIYHYAIAPDIGASLADLDALRSYYREMITNAGGALVELDVVQVARVQAVRLCLKVPQPQSGMTYIASLTLPFRDFSFVVKTQCAETGMTGMRDTVVFAKLGMSVNAESGVAEGWAQDPYDPTFVAPLLRNRSDDSMWDEKFPEHPLSRCRRYLDSLGDSISLADGVASAPPFTGPRAPSPAKARWWWPFGGKG